MASQTGSIDLTASNSVKLAAEAGWQSDLDSYYTKSEIDVTVSGINSTVSTKVGEDEVISSINQSSESVSINANKINLTGAVTISDLATDASDALDDAAKTATNYATDITGGGVMVHPSDDATSGVRITSDVDIMRDGTSVINIGTNDAVRIGVDDPSHVKMFLESSAMSIENEAGNEIFAVEANSTGTTIESVIVDSAVTWSDISEVTTATTYITDENAASGIVTAIAVVDNTRYELDSTYATTSVVVGSRVTVALTSTGVTYVQGLMTVVDAETGTTTYQQGSLSVKYVHTISDSAILTMDGRQVINGVRTLLTLSNDQWSSSNKTDNFMLTKTNGPNNQTYGVAFGVGSGGSNRGVYDATKGTWIIYRDASGQTIINSSKAPTIINGTNFLVDSSGAVYAGRKVAVSGNRKVSLNASTVSGSVNRGVYDDSKGTWLVYRGNHSASGAETQYEFLAYDSTGQVSLRANTQGNRGIYDVTESKWSIYRDSAGGLYIGQGADTVHRYTNTCTVNSTNATIYNSINHCCHNNVVATVTICINLKSSLASGSTVSVATAPANYRPPFNVVGSCYITGANASAMAMIGTGGGITLNNRSGSAITSSANIYMSFTFAL